MVTRLFPMIILFVLYASPLARHDNIVRRGDFPSISNYEIEKDPSFILFQDSKTGLGGYQSSSGKIIIRPQFSLFPFSSVFSKYGIADIMKNGKWYRINKKGEIVHEPYIFDNGPDYYVQGLTRIVGKNGKLGFACLKGNIVIEPSFDWATPFFFTPQKVTVVCKGCTQEQIPDDHCGHTHVVGGKWGLIGERGKVLIPLEYDNFGFTSNRELLFKKGEKSFKVLYDQEKNNYKIQTFEEDKQKIF